MSFTMTPDLMLAQASGESGNNPNIGQHYAPNDPLGRTAGGMFGFTMPTWQGLMANHPELGLTAEGKNDPAQQQRAYPVFTADNAKALQAAGVHPTASTVSLASFLGPKAAAAFAKADPNASVLDTLTASVGPAQAKLFMASNPTILSPSATVGQVIAHNDATHVNGGLKAPTSDQGGMMPSNQPMPDLPALPTSPGPSPVAQAPQAAPGSDATAIGLAMMGGAPSRQGFAAASQAYQAALDRQQALDLKNAGFQNDAINRDTEAPFKAFDAAYKRAAIEAQLRGQNVTSDTSRMNAQDSAAARVQAAQFHADQMRLAQQDRDDRLKQTTQFIDRGPDGTGDAVPYTMQTTNGGDVTYKNTRTGQTVDSLPATAMTLGEDRALTASNMKTNQPLVTKMAHDADASMEQTQRFQRAIDLLHTDGANATPGVLGEMGRGFDRTFGTSMFGDLGTTQLLSGHLMQDMLGQFQKAGSGNTRVTDSLRGFIQQAQPHLGQDPAAIEGMTRFLMNQNAMPKRVQDEWSKLSPKDQSRIMATGNVAQWQTKTRESLMNQDAAELDAAKDDLMKKHGAAKEGETSPSAARPPIKGFYTDQPAAAAAAKPPSSTSPLDFSYVPQ